MTPIHPLDRLDQLKDQHGPDSPEYRAALRTLEADLAEVARERQARTEALKASQRVRYRSTRLFSGAPSGDSHSPDEALHQQAHEQEAMNRRRDNAT